MRGNRDLRLLLFNHSSCSPTLALCGAKYTLSFPLPVKPHLSLFILFLICLISFLFWLFVLLILVFPNSFPRLIFSQSALLCFYIYLFFLLSILTCFYKIFFMLANSFIIFFFERTGCSLLAIFILMLFTKNIW